jgi:hypothetical protein
MKFEFARAAHVLLPVSLAVLVCTQAATATAQAQPAAPLQVDRSVKLSFTLHASVALPAVPATKETIALLRFGQPTQSEDSIARNSRPVATGTLSWSVSPAGTRVSDRATGSTAFTAALTSGAIRSQAIVHDSARGAVWFYGDALYRYRIATAELYRFKPASRQVGLIRKAVVTAAGVWLATESGALLFDDAAETFRTLDQAGIAPLVNAAAVGQTLWLASEQPRLIKVSPAANGRVTIAVSDKLRLGVPAEMIGIEDTLWLLLSTDHGDAYRVAYVTNDHDQLDVVAGRYFSLREDSGRLVAGAHARLLTIDPRARNAVAHTLDATDMPGGLVVTGGVMFLGSSYGVKDPSEIVERRPLDLSRGWSEPELRSASAATRP